MRKTELHAKIAALETRNAELEHLRDEVLGRLHAKADNAEAAVKTLTKAVTGHGEELAGLGASVRAALLARAEDKPEPVTPITAKRGTKATG